MRSNILGVPECAGEEVGLEEAVWHQQHRGHLHIGTPGCGYHAARNSIATGWAAQGKGSSPAQPAPWLSARGKAINLGLELNLVISILGAAAEGIWDRTHKEEPSCLDHCARVQHPRPDGPMQGTGQEMQPVSVASPAPVFAALGRTEAKSARGAWTALTFPFPGTVGSGALGHGCPSPTPHSALFSHFSRIFIPKKHRQRFDEVVSQSLISKLCRSKSEQHSNRLRRSRSEDHQERLLVSTRASSVPRSHEETSKSLRKTTSLITSNVATGAARR